ncbi:MAG: hypothetical protein KC613_16115, partial [Myxococcales bacterium]|nr:hypothetical protein [Myxococcales bacterium]
VEPAATGPMRVLGFWRNGEVIEVRFDLPVGACGEGRVPGPDLAIGTDWTSASIGQTFWEAVPVLRLRQVVYRDSNGSGAFEAAADAVVGDGDPLDLAWWPQAAVGPSSDLVPSRHPYPLSPVVRLTWGEIARWTAGVNVSGGRLGEACKAPGFDPVGCALAEPAEVEERPTVLSVAPGASLTPANCPECTWAGPAGGDEVAAGLAAGGRCVWLQADLMAFWTVQVDEAEGCQCTRHTWTRAVVMPADDPRAAECDAAGDIRTLSRSELRALGFVGVR